MQAVRQLNIKMKKITKTERKILKEIPSRKIYSITTYRILFYLLPFFMTLLIGVGASFLDNWNVMSYVNMILFLFLLNAPLFYLIFNHIYYSPIIKIKFDIDNNSLKLFYNKKIKVIPFSDIHILEIIENNGFRMPWSFIELAVIHLKNKDKIYISCLLLNPITFLSFNIGGKLEMKKSFFPLMHKNCLR